VKVYRPDGSLRPINESPALLALQGEVVKNQEEIICMPVHGKLRYRQVSAAPVRDKSGNIIGSVSVARDITEHKKAEEMLAKIEIARKKEIHHRIKNNLQVISSLLDLQAEKFNNRECIKDSEVLAAFRESQDRVISIALIHEELHEGEGDNELNFSAYLKKLIENLFQTYRIGNAGISLKIDLEENLFFDVDTAVPLGMIVNELVSNSFKHAFPGGDEKGIIQIKLSSEKSIDERSNKGQLAEKDNAYTLIVSDNGVGIPRNIDFENPDTLGLQLVAILVDQLGGEIEMERDKGTEFRIRVNVKQT
jgi:two-component sensor histidine kinase